jgi:tetratricopeptide (TPR) repeat protein
MKETKINIISLCMIFTLSFVALCAVSCAVSCSPSSAKSPDMETIRLYIRASDAYAKGRFADVMELLQKQNNFPPALVLRAKAEYFSGDLDKAEKSCRRAIKLRPSSLEAALYLARVLREKGDLAGAERVVESLLADNPQDIRALRLSAELASDARKFDGAAIFLDRAVEFSAESALVLLDRARLRWTAGKKAEALEDLGRAKAMLPWDTPLLRSISNLEKTIKEVE